MESGLISVTRPEATRDVARIRDQVRDSEPSKGVRSANDNGYAPLMGYKANETRVCYVPRARLTGRPAVCTPRVKSEQKLEQNIVSGAHYSQVIAINIQ